MKINKPKDGMMWRHTQTVSGDEQDGSDLITNTNKCDFPFCSCLSWCKKQRLS